jgi:hydroxypyruvate reductase
MEKERKLALEILNAAIDAASPVRAIERWVKLKGSKLLIGEEVYDLKGRVFIIGGGKASAEMAWAMEDILGDHITAGVVNTKYGYGKETSLVRVIEAGHPIPDENGVLGVKEMVKLLKEAGEWDLVICLISGGGSALMPLPAEEITLKEQQEVTELMLRCGATINEINTLRKHLSRIKGGQLARLAYPASVVSLILSDVVGDPLDVIASGPTVPDPTTFDDAYEILKRYDLLGKAPRKVVEHLKEGMEEKIPETPKEGDPIFSRTHNLVIANNRIAVEAACEKARELGFNVTILSTFIEGEACEVGKVFAAVAKEILSFGDSPVAVIAGGETTVTIKGKGKGGRNQELALSAAIKIDGLKDVIIASLATDGTDGPTDAAGAMVDGHTVTKAVKRGLDPLRSLDQNDSYNLLKQTGDLIVTGPTNTNVNDLMGVFVF